MAEKEEFTPQWSEKQIQPGQYIWSVYLKSCLFRESATNGEVKPFMQLAAIVEDPPDGPEDPYTGTEVDFRIYMHAKSQGWCLYFLKKFGYSEALLANPGRPIIRRAEVAGLHGKILVNVAPDDQGLLRFDVKGFGRLGENELEERLAKKSGAAHEAAEASMDTVEVAEVIDLEADVRAEATPNLEMRSDVLDEL